MYYHIIYPTYRGYRDTAIFSAQHTVSYYFQYRPLLIWVTKIPISKLYSWCDHLAILHYFLSLLQAMYRCRQQALLLQQSKGSAVRVLDKSVGTTSFPLPLSLCCIHSVCIFVMNTTSCNQCVVTNLLLL